MKKRWLVLFVLLLLLICCVGCRTQETEQSGQTLSLANYSEANIGVLSGSIHEKIVETEFPNATISYYNAVPDMAIALNSGAIDAFSCAEAMAREILKANEGLVSLNNPVGTIDCAFAFRKTDDGLLLSKQMSEYILSLKQSGVLDAMHKAWVEEGLQEEIDFPQAPEGGRTLVFATTGTVSPFSFFYNGKISGYDVAMAADFCREYGYGMTVETLDFAGIIPGMKSGLYDFAGTCITITDERAENVWFSEPNHYSNLLLLVRGADEEQTGNYWESVSESFRKTFIREDRWKMIAEGIGTTVYIAFFASLLGTLFGFGLCLLRRLRSRLLFSVTTVYIRILQGTPLVVLLMVLYYLVFPSSGLSGKWVAVIAFAMNFGAYVSEMIRTGIEAVDPGQMEAALALGFPKHRAFFKFVFPQAARHFLPVYKGEFISLVKMTSVVGYIAVQDLTKMSDLIRSRTYEAFFPLISTALIYFLISWGLSSLLHLLELKTAPDRKHRTVKGVTMQ